MIDHGWLAAESLPVPTNAVTGEFNDLEAEFEAAGSEIETVAREEICGDVYTIAAVRGGVVIPAEHPRRDAGNGRVSSPS